ncbi:MAG: MBG domain-containing protein, partial [Cyclobacteriaceae bacterium]
MITQQKKYAMLNATKYTALLLLCMFHTVLALANSPVVNGEFSRNTLELDPDMTTGVTTITDFSYASGTVPLLPLPVLPLAASITAQTNVSCHGAADGSVTLTVTGGIPDYFYHLSNGIISLTNTISGLSAGTYTVWVTDGNFDDVEVSFTITEPTALVAGAAVTIPLYCHGDTDGQVAAYATGGTHDYSYVWNTGGTAAVETGIEAGTYTVTITDEKGCSDEASVTLSEPDLLVSSTIVNRNVSTYGASDGQVTATASGGTENYLYSWSNGATTASISGVAAGTYTVTITDANECTATAQAIVTEPAQPVLTYSGDGFTEHSSNDGAVTGSISITLSGDTFQDTDADNMLDVGTEVTLGNVPAGLTAQVAITGNAQLGDEWNLQELSEFSGWYDIVYAQNKFVAVANSGTNRIMWSEDAQNWNFVAAPSAIGWKYMAYGNGTFVAIADNGTNQAMYSTNGINWQLGSGLPTSEWRTLIFVDGVFHAYGSAVHAISTDGQNWTSESFFTTFTDVVYGGGKFVAVLNSSVYTSLDGENWNTHTSPNSSLQSITYGNGLYVAASSSGTQRLMTSSDGVNWSVPTVSLTPTWNMVAFIKDRFLVAGSSITGLVSFDGADWSEVGLGNQRWRGAAYGDDKIAVVGSFNANIVSSIDDVSLEITLAGAAEEHQDVDDISDITFEFADAAFNNSTATSVLNATGPASSALGIDFSDNVDLTYAGQGFAEGGAKDGSVTGSIIITLRGDNFQDTDADNLLDIGSEVTVSNIPDGLTAVLTLSSATEVVLTLTGNANDHQNMDDVSDLIFDFDDDAFESLAASAVTNATAASSGLGIDFENDPFITYTGAGFTESSDNDGSVTGAIEMALTGESYEDTDMNGRLEVPSQVNIGGLPSGLTPTVAVSTVQAGVTWEAHQAPQYNWTSIAYGNGIFVALESGGDNQVITSTDGISWTTTSSNVSGSRSSVTYGEGLFVAVGSSANKIMTSPDGVTWTARSVPGTNQWISVTYGGGQFVALSGFGPNQVMTSPDGITWTVIDEPIIVSWKSITYGNGRFVAVGDGSKALVSTDGVNWMAHDAATSARWTSISYGSGLFVAVSDEEAQVMTSPDGESWTLRQTPEDNGWRAITYGGGLFAVVADNSSDFIMTSPDGINWTKVAGIAPSSWSAITYGNGRFVSVANSGSKRSMTSFDQAIATLSLSGNVENHQSIHDIQDITFEFTDGAFVSTQAAYVINATGPASSGLGIDFKDNPVITYSGTGFAESTNNDGSVEGSLTVTLEGDFFLDSDEDRQLALGDQVSIGGVPDGLIPSLDITQNILGQDWEDATDTDISGTWSISAYGNGTYVAINNHNTSFVYSTDGVNWTEGQLDYSEWWDMAYADGKFVSVGESGYVMTSADGIDWSYQAVSGYWGGITYGEGRYVAVGYYEAMTSTDGINWTELNSIPGADWYSVAYGNGVFVAVSPDSPYLMTSEDGIAWTAVSDFVVQSDPLDIAFGNGRFVAFGNNDVYSSTDGLQWTSQSIGFDSWNSITYGAGQFIIAGSAQEGSTAALVSTDGQSFSAVEALNNKSLVYPLFADGDFFIFSNNSSEWLLKSEATSAVASLTFSGKAAAHQDVDDVADIIFEFTDAAFANTGAANVFNATGPASSDLGIDFEDNPFISYSGDGFAEATANVGSVIGSITISLTGDTFQDADMDNMLEIGSEVAVHNIPVGLAPQLTINSSTEAVLTLSGNADEHQNTNDVSAITFEFTDAAFGSFTAEQVLNATGPADSDLGIDFADNPANDLCTSPQILTLYAPGEGIVTEGMTLSAAINSGLNPCTESTSVRDVWYSFNSGTSGQVVIMTELGTASAISGAIYTSCGEILELESPFNANVPACANNVSEPVFVSLAPNTEFLLQIWMADEDAGSFSVVLEENLPPSIATIADKTVDEETELQFTVTAIDEFLPFGGVEFFLEEEFTDLGMNLASVDAVSAQFSWTPTEAQGGTYEVTILAADYFDGLGNVSSSSATFTITVNEVNEAPVITAIQNQEVDVSANNLGSPATFTYQVEASDVDVPVQTLVYSLNQTAIDAGIQIHEETGEITWTPQVDNYGTTYSVEVSVSDGVVSSFEAFTIEVTKSNQTITFDELPGKTYGDGSVELTASSDSDLSVSYASSDETVATVDGSTVTIVGAGTTIITASQLGDDDFNAALAVEQTLTISAKAITVTADEQSKTYGEEDPELTFAISNEALLVEGDAFAGSLARVAGENVGTYAIQRGSLFLSDNYALTYESDFLTIGAKAITVTADEQSKIYGEEDPELTYEITSGELAFEDAISGSLTREAGESVGSYDIQQGDLSLNDNYDLNFEDNELTITERAITIAADEQSKTYGDQDPELTYEITSGGLAFEDAISGSLTREAGESVGTYAIQPGGLSLNDNYDLSFEGNELTITERTITITADEQSKTYGDEDPELTYEITSGELAFEDAFSGTIQREAGEDVGTYTIEQGSLTLGDNYDLSFESHDLTITERAITVTADVQSKTYGDEDPELTYEITSGELAFEDAFSGTLEREAGEDVGSYAIEQGSLSLSDNYDLSFESNDLTITERAITVTAAVQSKTYGDEDPELTYEITSGQLAFEDAFSGTLEREIGEDV